MPRNKKIMISSADRDRLLKLIDSARLDRRMAAEHITALEKELARATVVLPGELPSDVISMNSTVWFRDLDTQEFESYTLVYPHEADVTRDRISILAPIGTALLGFRLHDIVHWQVPQGVRKLEIIDVSQAAPVLPAGVEELLAS